MLDDLGFPTLKPGKQSADISRTAAVQDSTLLDNHDKSTPTTPVPLLPQSSNPLHVQLADILRERIASREWAQGSYIPSESDLMALYGISRGTVRRAIHTLVTEGLLQTKKGSGTIVATNDFSRPSAEGSLSFAGALRDAGVRYSTHVLLGQVVPAPREVAEHLLIEAQSPVLFLRRVRSVDGRPVVCQESWSNLLVCPGLEKSDFEHESLFDAVERCSGGRIAQAHMRYRTRLAQEEHASYLDCDAADPVLVLEQCIELSDGRRIEWSLTWLGPGQSVVGVSNQCTALAGPLDLGGLVYTHNDIVRSDDELRRRLEFGALKIRRSVVELAHRYEGTAFHFGGALSEAELISVLFGEVMNLKNFGKGQNDKSQGEGQNDKSHNDKSQYSKNQNETAEGKCDCDRFILSKAHASIGLFSALLDAGYISKVDLDKGVFGPDAVLFKHPMRDTRRGFETSGGSLGMGLGYAAGLAVALRRKHSTAQVYCVVGDGECDEGSIWESAAFAGHQKLSNLTVIVDANGMQLDGATAEILDSGPLQRKFASFGFEVQEVDGHDVLALAQALRPQQEGAYAARPRCIVARTVKGHGLSFAEGRITWHDHALNEELYLRACAELDAQERELMQPNRSAPDEKNDDVYKQSGSIEERVRWNQPNSCQRTTP